MIITDDKPVGEQAPAQPVGLDLRADRNLFRGDQAHGAPLRAGHLSEPARDDHGRADARRLCLGRHAGELPALVVRQAVHPQREELPARPHGPGLRDRDQFRSLHRLPDGREHHADAGAGDGACLLRPQLVLQGQLPVPDVDRCQLDRRLPGLRQGLHRRVRGAARRGRGGGGARLLPRADALRRRPLPPAAEDLDGGRGNAAQGPRGLPAAAGQRHVAHAAQGRRQAVQEGAPALSRGAAGEHPVLHREERAAAGALAARDRAHRAQGRPVLLSAAPDPGHERGLGDVLALHAAQRHVRPGPAVRRLHDRVPQLAHQRGVPAAGDASGLQRDQSVRAGLRHVHRPAPHLRAARPTRTASGSRRSPAPTGTRRSTMRCGTSRTRASSASTCHRS